MLAPFNNDVGLDAAWFALNRPRSSSPVIRYGRLAAVHVVTMLGGCSSIAHGGESAPSSIVSASPGSRSGHAALPVIPIRPCNVDLALGERERARWRAASGIRRERFSKLLRSRQEFVFVRVPKACRKRFDSGLDGQRYWILLPVTKTREAIRRFSSNNIGSRCAAYSVTRNELSPDCHCRLFVKNDGLVVIESTPHPRSGLVQHWDVESQRPAQTDAATRDLGEREDEIAASIRGSSNIWVASQPGTSGPGCPRRSGSARARKRPTLLRPGLAR